MVDIWQQNIALPPRSIQHSELLPALAMIDPDPASCGA